MPSSTPPSTRSPSNNASATARGPSSHKTSHWSRNSDWRPRRAVEPAAPVRRPRRRRLAPWKRGRPRRWRRPANRASDLSLRNAWSSLAASHSPRLLLKLNFLFRKRAASRCRRIWSIWSGPRPRLPGSDSTFSLATANRFRRVSSAPSARSQLLRPRRLDLQRSARRTRPGPDSTAASGRGPSWRAAAALRRPSLSSWRSLSSRARSFADWSWRLRSSLLNWRCFLVGWPCVGPRPWRPALREDVLAACSVVSCALDALCRLAFRRAHTSEAAHLCTVRANHSNEGAPQYRGSAVLVRPGSVRGLGGPAAGSGEIRRGQPKSGQFLALARSAGPACPFARIVYGFLVC